MKPATLAVGALSLILLSGCGALTPTMGGANDSGDSLDDAYGMFAHTMRGGESTAVRSARVQRYKEFEAQIPKNGPLADGQLVRGGRTTELKGEALLKAITESKDNDYFKIGPGVLPLNETPSGAPIRIEGAGRQTVVIPRFGVKLKDMTVSNATLYDAKFMVLPGQRLWLEQVVMARGCDSLGATESSAPPGTSVVSVLGGFYLAVDYGSPRGDANAHYSDVSSARLATVSLERDSIPHVARGNGLTAFVKEYRKYLLGGPRPSQADASRAYAFIKAKLDGGDVGDFRYHPNPAQAQALHLGMWRRAAEILRRDFGATSGPAADSSTTPALIAKADAEAKAQRPLSAIYHLARAYGGAATPAESDAIRERIVDLRKRIGAAYGTSLEFELDPRGVKVAKWTDNYINTRKGMVSSYITGPAESLYPILRIADANAARYKIRVDQTRDEFTSTPSVSSVEERIFQEEDPAVRAQRAAAASKAMWDGFENGMKGVEATADSMTRTWQNAYNYRTRVEETSSGKQLVWYEGDRNAGNKINPSAPKRAAAPEPAGRGMVNVGSSVESLLFVNRREIRVVGAIRQNGQVIDSLSPIVRSTAWNFRCTTTTERRAGQQDRVNSDCFGGTGGGGADLMKIAADTAIVPWISAHYQGRVVAEHLPRLAKAAKAGDKREMAELILLGRSLGIKSSPDQEAVLTEVFADAKPLDKILSATSGL